MRKRNSACAGVACAAGLAASASATSIPLVVYNFGEPPANAAGLSLWVEITAGVNNTVAFTFQNDSEAPNENASIVNIYFENSRGNTLIGTGVRGSTIGNVVFEDGGMPQNPAPGGLNWNGTDQWFSAKPPPAHNGIGKNESLTINFPLLGGATVSDVVSAVSSGEFRIAQHVTSLGDGGSVWTVTVIPLPGTAGLGALGLGLIAIRRRR